MIELLISAIISSADIDTIYKDRRQHEVDKLINYANIQLETLYTPLAQTVTFDMTMPEDYIEALRESIEAAGWSASVSKVKGFYDYESCYHFVLNKK